MAKKCYVGINGIPKNVKNIYVGVNGVPKKVKKGYVGVNGVARLFWDASSPAPVYSKSWDWWSTIYREEILHFQNIIEGDPVNVTITSGAGDSWRKPIIYYGWFYCNGESSAYPAGYYVVAILNVYRSYPPGQLFMMSTGNHATGYYDSGHSVYGFNWWIDNTVYYYESGVKQSPYDVPPTIQREQDAYLGEFSQPSDAAGRLLDNIISTPFQHNYQQGQTYTLNTTNIKRTIRKAVSTFLHRNVGWYQSSSRVQYKTMAANADTIIDTLCSMINSSGMIQVTVREYGIEIEQASLSQISNASLRWAKQTANYYDYYYFITSGGDYSVNSDIEVVATIDSSGNITYDTYNPEYTDVPDIMFTAGLFADVMESDSVFITNIGVNL